MIENENENEEVIEASVDWLCTYDYEAKHRAEVENDFECPCDLCNPKGKHRAG